MPRVRRFLALAALLAYIALSPAPIAGVSSGVVISQVYGGGGNTSAPAATLRNDFIELFNRGTSPVDLTGWSVQYASSAGSSWQRTPLTNVILQPGQYYLVQEAAGTGGTANLPAPDAIGSIPMSGTAAKVALVSNSTMIATGTSCPSGASIVDFVGYGTGTNCFEGAGPTGTLNNVNSAQRASGGCVDTDSNNADFSVGLANPRNTASPRVLSCDSTAPTITSAAANPSLAFQGGQVTFTVTVKPGTNPINTALTVTGDFSSIGANAPFTLTGSNLATGEQTFSATVNVTGTQGPKSIPVTVTDGVARQATKTMAMAVRAATTTRIHDIQGPASASPLAGTTLTTEGVVTGRRSNGFFIQDLEANYDADLNSSEGVFVFTSSAPPAAAAVGSLVVVIGTVSEFVPTSDPYQPPQTEIVNPYAAAVSTGIALPAAVALAATDLDAAASVEQLERLEGMRVSMASAKVVAPTGGSQSEANATSTSNGVFYVVLPDDSRPFREPGIEVFEPVPSDALSPATVPRFDANPERIRVDSDAIGGVTLDVTPGQLVANLVGPLDYGFRSYTIDLDPASPTVVSGPALTAVPARAPAAGEFTIASANLERFFDTFDDPGTSDAVLTPAAFNTRLSKVSLQIRNTMGSPDIVGVQEVENLATLQAIAGKVNGDAIAAGDLDPAYVAYLFEGNDIGGIDSGFLVKSSRVTVLDVTQEGLTTQFVQPDGALALLNDRPPVVLRALIHETPGDAGTAVTAIVNHLRSLSSINSATDGARVRAKRQAQAEFLANLIQGRQSANRDERMVSVGDYNAFQFNDGYVDSIGTIKGTPAPPQFVTLASSDLVNPDLVDLVDTAPADQRYSFVFNGNAQELDHVIVTQNVIGLSNGLSYGRNNADFPDVLRGDPNTPVRISDHDPVVAYFAFPIQTTTTLQATPLTPTFGQPVTLTATVQSGASSVTRGTVTFTEGATTLAGPLAVGADGTASFTTTTLTGGHHTITAQYNGSGALQPSTVTVDVAVLPSISIDDVTVREGGDALATARLTVTLSAASTDTITVDFATTGGTATSGIDFVATSGTLVFVPGVLTQTIDVDVLANPRRERTETFFVNLSGATDAVIGDAEGVGSIIDLREPPLAIRTFAPGRRAVGSTIVIVGTGFADVNGVSFNGTPAAFTIVSSTVIRAVVPAGATTGAITVTTAYDTATSAASFTVVP